MELLKERQSVGLFSQHWAVGNYTVLVSRALTSPVSSLYVHDVNGRGVSEAIAEHIMADTPGIIDLDYCIDGRAISVSTDRVAEVLSLIEGLD